MNRGRGPGEWSVLRIKKKRTDSDLQYSFDLKGQGCRGYTAVLQHSLILLRDPAACNDR